MVVEEEQGKQRNGGSVVEKEGRQWNSSSGSGGEKTIELCRGDGGKEEYCGGGVHISAGIRKYGLSSVT